MARAVHTLTSRPAPRALRAAAVVAAVVPALTLSGCGSKSTGASGAASGSSSGAASATPSTTISVPAAVASKGTLTVAADASYAPNEFIAADGHTVQGMDADLAQAIGAKLGLKVTVVNAAFDSILPGLTTGKYDLGMSSFTDTKAREKTVDFVDYFSAGTSFFAKAGASSAPGTLTALCGHSVSVERGTTQLDDATAADKTCRKAGKPGVKVQPYPDQNGANLALSTGRADVSMADSPVAAYQVKLSHGMFALVGQPYGAAPYGIAVPRSSGLTSAVQAAVTALIADGSYTKILTTWGVQSGAVSTVTVNGAMS